MCIDGLPWRLSGTESTCNAGVAGGAGSIPGSGRSDGGEHGSPLQCSYLENPMNRGDWRGTVHTVTNSQTQLKQLCTHMCLCISVEYITTQEKSQLPTSIEDSCSKRHQKVKRKTQKLKVIKMSWIKWAPNQHESPRLETKHYAPNSITLYSETHTHTPQNMHAHRI